VTNLVAVVALGVALTARRSTSISRVVIIAALAPLDTDLEALHVDASELCFGFTSSSFFLVLNESVGAVTLDVASSELVELIFELK